MIGNGARTVFFLVSSVEPSHFPNLAYFNCADRSSMFLQNNGAYPHWTPVVDMYFPSVPSI
jgi:hypothetical protein